MAEDGLTINSEERMRRVRSVVPSIAVLSLLLASPAAADPISFLGTSTLSSGTWSANGHQYAVIAAPRIAWDDASAAAAALPGGSWHLATITSEAEQDFVAGLKMSGEAFWLGGFQMPGSSSPAEGWSWVTGEALSYANWARGEANDHYGAQSEQHLTMWVKSRAWNDEGNLSNISGFIVESTAPVPEPGTLALFGLGTVGSAILARRRRQRASR